MLFVVAKRHNWLNNMLRAVYWSNCIKTSRDSSSIAQNESGS